MPKSDSVRLTALRVVMIIPETVGVYCKMVEKDAKSLKVIHIAPTPFFSDRGCHIRIRNEIEALSGGAAKVILCTYHLGQAVQGIDTRRIPMVPGYTNLGVGFSPYKFPADILLFLLTLKTVWRERPDILHGHLHEGALIGWVVKWCLFWRRMCLIMDMQGSLSGELIGYGTLEKGGWLTWFVRTIEGLIYRMPRLILCSSESSRNLIVERFKVPESRTVLLQDAVPDAFLHKINGMALRQRLGIGEDRTVIVYSGSLLPGKGVQHVLDSIKELKSRRDLYFILIGYPVEDVQHYLKDHDLQESVLLQGRVAYDDLAGWLTIADIALDPKEETTGEASGKILHYMAAGLPVVCFDTPNNRALLGANGYYAQRDGGSFRQMIESAVDDQPGRLERGRSGQHVILDSYSLGNVERVLTHHYQASCSL